MHDVFRYIVVSVLTVLTSPWHCMAKIPQPVLVCGHPPQVAEVSPASAN